MDPTSSIRRLGFRKWYERQLIDCHLSLVTCFLAGLLMAALLESVNFADFGWKGAMMIGIILVAGVIGWFSYRRYITVLGRAELYGQRSSCPNCQLYGRFDIISTGMDSVPGVVATAVAPLEAAWLNVRCRKCATTWRIPE